MSEEEKEEEEYSIEEERKKLADLGVDNTWDILTTREKKGKEPEKKPFRGFN
ncbi:MAG: hypothetical protein ACFFFT_13535 [Candidatus Thorarchaeota archaeon]